MKIVFNQGTQLVVRKKSELSSIRLLLSGYYEEEKKLASLFFLSEVYTRKIRDAQYKVMNDLTNSSRNVEYLNEEINNSTKHLLNDLKIVRKNLLNYVIQILI